MSETREANYKGVFDNSIGFGERPAVIVIDFIKVYTTQGAAFFGQGVVDAVEATVGLLTAARAARVPIIYTKVLYHPSGMDGGLFVKKVPALRKLVAGEPLAEIDTRIPPAPEDLVIVKNYPSCFFGTSLASTLAGLSIDTLVPAGVTINSARVARITAGSAMPPQPWDNGARRQISDCSEQAAMDETRQALCQCTRSNPYRTTAAGRPAEHSCSA